MNGFIDSKASFVLPELMLIENTYSDFVYPRHFHETYCVQIVDKGSDRLYCNGSNYRNIKDNAVVLINPGEIHTGGGGSHNSTKEQLVCKVFYFGLSEWNNILGDSFNISQKLSDARFKTPVITDKRIVQSIKEMFSLKSSDENNLLIKELYHEIMCSLAEQQLPNPIFFDEDFKKYAEAIKRGKEYINDNLNHKFLLDDIARAAYISPFHFLRIFKRFTGITLHQYVLSLRVERAKSFFRQQLSIAETFNRLGFSNQVHFTRVFKKMTGLTPMQYKRIVNPAGLPSPV